MTLDATARATASLLLNKFGKPCVYKQVQQGAYDPANGMNSALETNYQIKAFIESPNAQDLASGQVVMTDEVAIFAALGLPESFAPNDRMEIDGKDRLVKAVKREWSGAQVALFRVVLAS